MKRKREDRSTTGTDETFASPFAKLEALRAALPEGQTLVEHSSDEREVVTPARSGKVVVRREKKGRGGKTVTILEGIGESALNEVAAELKRGLGCGASVEGTAIVLAGEQEERVKALLEARGLSVVLGTRR